MCLYVYNFWYTEKILVPNRELVVIAIHQFLFINLLKNNFVLLKYTLLALQISFK